MSASTIGSPTTGLTTLDPADNYVVVVNTYTVSPDRAEEALAFLIRSTENTLRYVPGFVSANLHLNGDRTSIVNYSQWRSREDLDAARDRPDVSARIKEAAQFVEKFAPVQYVLRASIAASSAS